jgi:V8-like Glu-specific endopeptidase
MKHSLSIAASCALLSMAAGISHAQSAPVSKTNDESAAATAAFWTPERFKAAKPLPLPKVTPGTAPGADEQSAQPGRPQSSNANPPTVRMTQQEQPLFKPDPKATPSDANEVVEPEATGTFGAYYTSTRVFPMYTGANAPLSADRAYPYSTVGRLFFSINGQPYVCSASTIQRRVVVTAGHCVHSGRAGGFYSNWLFVPAFRDRTAPFLAWNWRYVIVTGTWATGGGNVPNAADYAMIEFADQPTSRGGPLRRVGEVVGWLGWQTLNLAVNHTSKLGYPCNLDSCQKMQDVTSNNFRNTSPNNVEYGSDMAGGSSGGPWVQNFQILQVGGGTGSNTGQDRVVGVTSYGYTSGRPKVQGASIPDGRWVELWNTICARVPGNCAP